MTVAYAFINLKNLGSVGSGTSPLFLGTGAVTFPLLTAGSSTDANDNGGSAELSLLEGYGIGTSHYAGTGSAVFPMLELSLTAGGNAAAVTLALEAVGTAHLSSLASGVIQLPKLRAYGEVFVGQVGAGATRFPLLTSTGSSHFISSAQGAPTFPILQVEAYSFTEIFYTTVLNVFNTAVSEYTNFNFNSYCEFPANNFLGASTSGLFRLFSGDTDNGDLISARMEFGISDFNEESKKRVCDGYINYRGSGTLELILETDEQEEPDIYNVIPIADGRLRNYRFKTSKYRQGKNWRITVQNKDGADLDINEIALLYDILSRRV